MKFYQTMKNCRLDGKRKRRSRTRINLSNCTELTTIEIIENLGSQSTPECLINVPVCVFFPRKCLPIRALFGTIHFFILNVGVCHTGQTIS